LTPPYLDHTQAHSDRFPRPAAMNRATGAPLRLHKADQQLWDNLELQCRTFGLPYPPAPPPDRWLKNDEELSLGAVTGIALHTPGHTPGSMCFHFEAAKLLLAGDTLFRESIGRTDLWGGDAQAIERSINTRLYTLDEDT